MSQANLCGGHDEGRAGGLRLEQRVIDRAVTTDSKQREVAAERLSWIVLEVGEAGAEPRNPDERFFVSMGLSCA